MNLVHVSKLNILFEKIQDDLDIASAKHLVHMGF